MAKTFTIATAAKLVQDDIEDLTLAELVAAFNTLAEKVKVNAVKKFADRPTAIKRVTQIIQQVGLVLLDEQLKAALKPTKIPKHVGIVARKPSVSGRCCELIRAGKTNLEIWEVIKAEFGFADQKKRAYPAWNRSDMRRRGEDMGKGAGVAG